MKAFITGGAGCIGSDLALRLLNEGNEVVIYDNLSSGKKEHIPRGAKTVTGDVKDLKRLKAAMKNSEVVFHLAANPDIKYKEGYNTYRNIDENIIGTYNVLEAMRSTSAKRIIFSSSSAVYGEARKNPVSEDYGPLVPISIYGATKLGCEGLITSYSSMFGMQSWIFRFANIVGPKNRKTGTTVITDFIHKLEKNPESLEILGNGKQTKSYMHVSDCIDGILYGYTNSFDESNIFNLGYGDAASVKDIAEIVENVMSLGNVEHKFTGTERGWPGDVRKIILDARKIRKLGWKCSRTSKQAIKMAVEEQWKR